LRAALSQRPCVLRARVRCSGNGDRPSARDSEIGCPVPRAPSRELSQATPWREASARPSVGHRRSRAQAARPSVGHRRSRAQAARPSVGHRRSRAQAARPSVGHRRSRAQAARPASRVAGRRAIPRSKPPFERIRTDGGKLRRRRSLNLRGGRPPLPEPDCARTRVRRSRCRHGTRWRRGLGTAGAKEQPPHAESAESMPCRQKTLESRMIPIPCRHAEVAAAKVREGTRSKPFAGFAGSQATLQQVWRAGWEAPKEPHGCNRGTPREGLAPGA
jgi:hypothetical protein